MTDVERNKTELPAGNGDPDLAPPERASTSRGLEDIGHSTSFATPASWAGVLEVEKGGQRRIG